MADQRMTTATIITDPTTSTQQAGVDASGNVKVIAAANSGVDIGDVDVTSIIPGTGATNLGKAVDSVAGATDTGAAILAVRDDALGGLTPAEGDYANLRVDANGAVWMIHSGTMTVTDDGSFTLAANSGVDIGDVDVTSIVPGTGATNLGKAEDAAHTTGDTGVMPLAVRQDTATSLSGTDGDYTPLIVDANGRLHVTDPNAGAGSPTSPTFEANSTTGLAAGSSTRIDHSTDLGGNTRKLTQVYVAGSVPFKVVIQGTENGSVTTTLDTLYSPAGGGSLKWTPPHKDYGSITFGANAGYDGFSATVTNLDSNDAADFYAGFYWET